MRERNVVMKRKWKGIMAIATFVLLMICLFLGIRFLKEKYEKHVFLACADAFSMKNYQADESKDRSNRLIVDVKDADTKALKKIKSLKGLSNFENYKNKAYLTFASVKAAESAYDKLSEMNVYRDARVSAQGQAVSFGKEAISDKQEGSLVAVIDTGVNGAAESIDLTGEGIADENGHGTTVARIIQEESGEKANFLSIKALDKNGEGSVAALTAAVEYATSRNVSIIHLSATAGYKVEAKPLQEAIRKAEKHGITVVLAAGNQGVDVKNVAPANVDEAVVVTALGQDGKLANYANYGSTVDYSALGTVDDVAGTSYAAAIVTGKILLYGEEKLAEHGVDFGDQGWDRCYGAASFGVEEAALQEGNIPADYYTDALFDTDDWEKLSDEELNTAFRWHSDYMVAVWYQSLSDAKQEKLLKRDTWLNTSLSDKESGKNMTYAQWLKKQKVSEAAIAAWTSTTGFFNVNVTGDGKTSSIKVNVKLSSTNSNKAQNFTFTTISGENAHKLDLGYGWDTEGKEMTMTGRATTTKSSSDGTSYTDSDGNTIYRAKTYLVLNASLSFIKPAYYYAAYSTSARTSSGKSTTVQSVRFNTRAYNWQNNGDNTWINMGAETTDQEKKINLQMHGFRIGLSTPDANYTTYELVNIDLKPVELKIDFDCNGGKGETFSKNYSYGKKLAESGGLPDPADFFCKTGYHTETDCAWSLTSEYSEKGFGLQDTELSASDIKELEEQTRKDQTGRLYANWKPNTYTIYYDGNGGKGNMTPTTAVYDQESSLRAESFSAPKGKSFAGWNEQADGSGKTYGNLESVKNLTEKEDGVVTLYAIWEDADYAWDEAFQDGFDTLEYPDPKLLSYRYPFTQSVEIYKTDDKGIPLENVSFTVTCKETGETVRVKTDEKGQAKASFEKDIDIAELSDKYFYYEKEDWESMSEQQQNYVTTTKGHYESYEKAVEAAKPYFESLVASAKQNFVIEEKSCPDYCQKAEKKEITITGENSEQVEIVNQTSVEPLVLSGEVILTPVFRVAKTKVDQKTPLSGVLISIYDTEGHVLLEDRTDENGYVEYQGDPVTFATKQYKYIDAGSTAMSESLKNICSENGWFTSYDEALAAYELDENYSVVSFFDGGKAREEKMTRTYSYQELETISGYTLDPTVHTVTVNWYESSDLYSNLTDLNATDGQYDPEDSGQEDDDEGFKEEEEPAYGSDTNGVPVDYSELLINEEAPKVATVSGEKEYTQKIFLMKKNPNGQMVSGAGYKILSDDEIEKNLEEVDELSEQLEKSLGLSNAKGIYVASFKRTICIEEGIFEYLENSEEMENASVEAWIQAAGEGRYRFSTKEEAEEALQEKLTEEAESQRHTYKIRETEAPAGYSLSEETIEAEATGDFESGNGAGMALAEAKDEYLGSIKLIKTNGSGEKLAKVSFTLFSTAVKEKGETYLYHNVKYYQLSRKETNEDGELLFDQLPAKQDIHYLIVETDTSEGNSLLKDAIEVGTLPMASKEAPEKNYEGHYYQDDDQYYYYDLSYKVTNRASLSMPVTGKGGNYWYGLLGIGCVLAGMYLRGQLNRFRKIRRKKSKHQQRKRGGQI